MSSLLSNLRAQRENTIERLTALLLTDERCVAAWLFGSIGRGDGDDLSDIDVWIVVRDADCESVVADRRSFVTQIGEPILTLEAPQNAPPYGGYLLAQYADEAGLQQIDWYWQPQWSAKIPSKVRLLFDRANLPIQDYHRWCTKANPTRRNTAYGKRKKMRFSSGLWLLLRRNTLRGATSGTRSA